MSDDKGESNVSAGETSAAGASGVASTGAHGKLPKGLVLGKDGKPYVPGLCPGIRGDFR